MSKIEWTDETWNPTRGCSRISPGCGGAAGVGGCYAERQAIRQVAHGRAYHGLVRTGPQGPRWTGKVILDTKTLLKPGQWKAPRRVFVNSMSDLFHENLTNEEIAAVFGVMAQCPQHTFQVLTKRAELDARVVRVAGLRGQGPRSAAGPHRHHVRREHGMGRRRGAAPVAAAQRVAGRVRRGSDLGGRARTAAAARARGGPLRLLRARPGPGRLHALAHRPAPPPSPRLDHRRWRERPWRAAVRPGVGRERRARVRSRGRRVLRQTDGPPRRRLRDGARAASQPQGWRSAEWPPHLRVRQWPGEVAT